MVQWNHMSSMVPRAIGGIGREEQRLGVHQLGEDDDRVVLSTETLEALAERRGRGGREGVQVGVHPVEEAEVVVELLQGLGAGRSVVNSKLPRRVSTRSGVEIDPGSLDRHSSVGSPFDPATAAELAGHLSPST
jgi:hypothetical protein